jgi:hypothetical protein
MFDGQLLGDTIVAQVKSYLEREVAPLKAENAELKARLKALEDRPEPENISPELLEAPELPDIAALVAEAVERAVAALPPPKDGKDAAGIVQALKDSGELVLTLEDGRLIRTGIRDGKKGKNGRDGFGFDDMDVAVLDDDRTIELSFRRGEEEKAFTLKWPTVIYRGVWRSGETYEAGDAVTWGGHMWIAERATTAKPDQPDEGWRIAVKRGRDGKDAKP